MEMIRHWKDLGGNIWKEIVSRDEKALNQLADEYRKKGCSTWIMPYNKEKSCLSVMEPAKEELLFGIAI